MWLIVVVLTVILWLLLDNILIAAMLAVFVVYSYTLVRALYLVQKKEAGESELMESHHTVVHHERRLIEKNEVHSEDVDTSYVDFMQDNYKK